MDKKSGIEKKIIDKFLEGTRISLNLSEEKTELVREALFGSEINFDKLLEQIEND